MMGKVDAHSVGITPRRPYGSEAHIIIMINNVSQHTLFTNKSIVVVISSCSPFATFQSHDTLIHVRLFLIPVCPCIGRAISPLPTFTPFVY